MELVKRIVERNKKAIVARCERCRREVEFQYTDTVNPTSESIDLRGVFKCECGEYHNLIITEKYKANRVFQSKHMPEPSYTNQVSCPKCGSTQFHASDKGFGVGKAVAGGMLTGSPVGLLGGFIGSKKTMITCLKCNYRWQAGKGY